jgi:glycosyltransferase involved in cell wall biosynthesis
MKILLISKYLPDDPRKVHGTFKRLGTFIEAIREIAKLDALFFVPPDYDRSKSRINKLQKKLSGLWKTDIDLSLCPMAEFEDSSEFKKWLSFAKGMYSFFNQKGRIEFSGEEQVRAVDKLLDKKHDAVFAHRISAMCPLLLTKKPLPPIFFDLDDLEHVVVGRYIKQRQTFKSNFLHLTLHALEGGEYNAIKLADRTAVCSKLDEDYLNNEFRLPGVVTIPNSVDIPKLEPITPHRTLMFLGSDYKPNLEAAEYLVNNIWPLVINELPSAKLIVAGTPPDKLKIDARGTPNLEVPGFVDGLDNLYRGVRATAVPILVAGGTRFKIIEAAAYGKPTVATAIGAEGIELEDGSEILIRDLPGEFAQACVKLLTDTELCTSIGLRARDKVAKLYDRKNVILTIRSHFEDLIYSRTL